MPLNCASIRSFDCAQQAFSSVAAKIRLTKFLLMVVVLKKVALANKLLILLQKQDYQFFDKYSLSNYLLKLIFDVCNFKYKFTSSNRNLAVNYTLYFYVSHILC